MRFLGHPSSRAGLLPCALVLTTGALLIAQEAPRPAAPKAVPVPEEVVVNENPGAGVVKPAVSVPAAAVRKVEVPGGEMKRVPRAISAHIVPDPVFTFPPGREIGNVCVQLADGKEEIWTTDGGCAWPKVAKSGLAGWLTGTIIKKESGWGSAGLLFVRNTKPVCTVKPGGYQVLHWNFADDDMTVEVVSRTLKGVTLIEKYGLRTAGLLASFEVGKDSAETAPEWVKPLLAIAEAEGQRQEEKAP